MYQLINLSANHINFMQITITNSYTYIHVYTHIHIHKQTYIHTFNSSVINLSQVILINPNVYTLQKCIF